jgi:hypothetical protein
LHALRLHPFLLADKPAAGVRRGLAVTSFQAPCGMEAPGEQRRLPHTQSLFMDKEMLKQELYDYLIVNLDR